MTQKHVLYLLPGLLCDREVWAHQISTLSPIASIKVPDFRPFDSFRAMARHVLEGAPATFSVAGHSMGGRVALELEHLAGDRITRLALLDAGAHPLQPGEKEERMQQVYLAENKGMKALADDWIPPMLHPDHRTDAQLVQTIRQMVLRHDSQVYRRHINAALNRADQSRYLSGIRKKVLLVCGEQDEWSPVAQHEEIARQIPEAELKIVPDAGHMVTMEQPEAVSALLLQWLTT
jgi:pimeloyl-ACP methyl ester carboxylesterase